MAPVRLHGRLHPTHRAPITSIRLRIIARRIPVGAHVDITDIQMQPGRLATGWTPATQDHNIQPVNAFQWRSGVVTEDCTVIVVADEEIASPTRWEITRANGTMQIGDYHLVHVAGSAIVDGIAGTATHGAGIPPHLTARADIDIPVKTGRACLSVCFRGYAAVALEPPPADPDPIDPDEPWDDPDEDDTDIEQPPEPPPDDPDDPGDVEEDDDEP